MNDHEIERIAAAMNHLRPDWPVKQLRTLLGSPQLASRPRRDVTVALAWVACESNTANPYRVLEAGPWWKAAGIEGTPTTRQPYDPDHFCADCGQPELKCRNNPHAEHDYKPASQHRRAAIDNTPAGWLRDLVAGSGTERNGEQG